MRLEYKTLKLAGHGNRENTRRLATMWERFQWPEKRLKTMGPFLEMALWKDKSRRIIDHAGGIGTESIYLLEKGYCLDCTNEIDPYFSKIAEERAKQGGFRLNIAHYNWLEYHKHFRKKSFDAGINVGSNHGYFSTAEELGEALDNLCWVLSPGGVYVADTRNTEYIWHEREKILGGNFRYSANYVYCENGVVGIPVRISDGTYDMEYTDVTTGKKAHICNLGLTLGLQKDLEKRFEKVFLFSDFKPGYDSRADFFQFVCACRVQKTAVPVK